MAQVFGVQTAVGIEFLGEAYEHGVTLVGVAHPDLQPSRHVLSEVHYHSAVALGHGLRSKCPHHLHARRHAAAQCSQRYRHALGIHPLRVVIASHSPVAQHLAGIVNLAVVLVVASYRTVGCQLPLRVGGYLLLLAVLVCYYQVGTQFGIAEVGYLVWFLFLLHGVVAPVAQHHSYCALALGEH